MVTFVGPKRSYGRPKRTYLSPKRPGLKLHFCPLFSEEHWLK